jgi:hypothetical protein
MSRPFEARGWRIAALEGIRKQKAVCSREYAVGTEKSDE